MTRSYTLGPAAIADLKSIAAYIALDNPAAAGRMQRLFFERFKVLAANSEMGQTWPFPGNDFRTISVGSYVIVFRPAENGVQIIRVLHGARDLETLLRNSPLE